MNWALLQQSLLLAATVAGLAVLLGAVCAVWSQTVRFQSALVAVAAIALALPPFLIANTWMHFFGLAGVWRKWIDFDLYSWTGAVLLMVLLLWPVSFFLVRAALARLEGQRLEIDPLLRGWNLLRHVIWPQVRQAVVVAAIITFVLALNHFSIPALLQTKVYSADVWVSFNTSFDYWEALRIGWPLIVAPLLLLTLVRRQIEIWPARARVQPELLARRLGGGFRLGIGVVSMALVAVSVVFPLGHLLASPKSWTEMPSALAAGHPAFVASLVTALGGATVALVLSIWFARKKWSPMAWLPFLVPGVILGIAVIRIFNQPAFNWFYPSLGIVVAALAVRYLALPLQAVAQARASIDPQLLAAARADGATARQAFWKTELPLLAGPIFFAWYVAYLFCLWDAETMILIVPPGGETLSLRVFNMLHYGHTDQVNALCLWLLVLAGLPLAVRMGGSRFFRGFSCLAVAVMFTSCAPRPENETEVVSQLFSHVEVFGTRGHGVGEFNKPRSIACDADDNFYVADMSGRIQKFSPTGQYLLSWQMPITEKGKPKGMILDRDGSIIVVEPHYNRLNYHRPDGSLAHQWGTQGTNAGQLVFPRSVAVNSAGETYVSEYGLVERVQRFSPGGTNLLTVIGAFGDGPGEFRRAEGIGIGLDDRLYVADSTNHRVQIFSREGKFLGAHGKAGDGPGEMSYPYDVRIDRLGYEYVCEFGNSRVQIFDRDGRPVESLGRLGGEVGQMHNPWSICLDSKGNLYVADSGNHRVQKFVRKVGMNAGLEGPSNRQAGKPALHRLGGAS